MKVTITVFQDTRRPKAGGAFPVKIRVTSGGIRKYYPTPFDLTRQEFDEVMKPAARGRLAVVRRKLLSLEAKANQAADKLAFFTFEHFEKMLEDKPSHRRDLGNIFEQIIRELDEADRAGTAFAYRNAWTSLTKFKPGLGLESITVKFLEDYERHMLGSGRSYSTVGMYLRALRTVINKAIEDGLYPRENYPFRRARYTIPQGRNVKKALDLDEIAKIIAADVPEDSQQYRARDMWLFSYLASGMNLADILELRWGDIEGDKLTFARAKTERTRKNGEKITVYLLDEAQEILQRCGNKDRRPESYIFPIYEPRMTASRKLAVKRNFIKWLNKWMQRLADDIGIKKPVGTYTARHSFATILKRSGTSYEFISEALGHSSLSTTQAYLDSFEDAQRKEHQRKLLPK